MPPKKLRISPRASLSAGRALPDGRRIAATLSDPSIPKPHPGDAVRGDEPAPARLARAQSTHTTRTTHVTAAGATSGFQSPDRQHDHDSPSG